jgi:transposase-like protein
LSKRTINGVREPACAVSTMTIKKLEVREEQLAKLLVEKALDAELTEHLGHERHEPVANVSGNTRNSKSSKTLKSELGGLPIEVPRDLKGTFEPQLISKHQTRWNGFDDKIISLYVRGMTVREGAVRVKAVHLAIGTTMTSEKEG